MQRKEEEEEGELPVLRMMVHHHPTVYEGLKEMKRMEDAILEKLFEEYDWEEEEKGGKKMENTGGKREGKKGVVKAARKV